MFIAAGIDHFMRDISLILSLTFALPLVGAITGMIAASIEVLHPGMKGTGHQDG